MTTDEADFFSKLWFLSGPGRDVMASSFRRKDGNWGAEYRFRYHHKAEDGEAWDPFDGKDEKRFYSIQAGPDDRAKVDDAMDMCIKTMKEVGFGDELHVVDVDGDAQKLLEVMAKLPFVHVKIEEKKDGEKDTR